MPMELVVVIRPTQGIQFGKIRIFDYYHRNFKFKVGVSESSFSDIWTTKEGETIDQVHGESL